MKKNLFSGMVIIFFAAFVFIGCEQKKETAEEQAQDTPADTQTAETPASADTINAKTEEQTDLQGEWTGNFGDRKMTLNITSQDGNSFEGETVVRWDSPKKEKVTGELNTDTREMKITETAGTRNNGVYTGTVSADMKKFTGVWRDNGNRQTYNITLTKQ